MISFEIKGLNELIEMADKYPAISEKHVNKAIKYSLIRIQDQAKQKAPFGTTGNLRNNWKIQMGRFEGKLSSGAMNNGYNYALAVQFGTKPHMVSGSSLSLWASRRGLNPYAVAKSIQRRGTKANPFFSESVESQKLKVEQEFEKALSNIILEL